LLLAQVKDEDELVRLHRQLDIDANATTRGRIDQRIEDLVANADSIGQLHRLEAIVRSLPVDRILDPDHPPIPVRKLPERKPWIEIPGLAGVIRDPSVQIVWEQKFHAMKRRVCRISADGIPGTGFLVAKNVILTTYHLVDRLIAGQRPGGMIRVWFDYDPGTATTEPSGELHRLDADWWIAYSKSSPVDDLPDDPRVTPHPDHLDYVLLRLADAPGFARGVVSMPADQDNGNLMPGLPLIMLQYAALRPLEIAVSPEGVVGFNENGTRLRHRLNTLGSSSGSPIFDMNWNLVAMHRGFVRSPPGVNLDFNDAIPIGRIRDHFLNNPGVRARLHREVGW